MKLHNPSDTNTVDVPTLGLQVPPGGAVDVDDDQAAAGLAGSGLLHATRADLAALHARLDPEPDPPTDAAADPPPPADDPPPLKQARGRRTRTHTDDTEA